MNPKTIEVQSVTALYEGFFKVNLLSFKHSLFLKPSGPILHREVFSRGQAVIVLLYDADSEVVILVEQCRPGALLHAQALDAPDQAWLLEPVAGMIDLGESPMQAGIREAKEEAGVDVSNLEYVCQYYPSPGGSDEILHLYAANIDSDQLAEYAGLSEEGEDIRVVKIPFHVAKSMLFNADFKVASTYIALQWLFFQRCVCA